MSDYVVVKYSDGKEETVKQALKDNHISISDLDRFNIKYIKTTTEKDIRRYDEIKESVSIAMDEFLNSTFIYRDDRNCNGFINGNITSDTLIKNGYLNSGAMLDTDNKSYCKAIAKEYINFLDNSKDVCEMKYEIYISCKKYKTPGFDELEYRSFSNYKHESISY